VGPELIYSPSRATTFSPSSIVDYASFVFPTTTNFEFKGVA